jgi:hypothetical protein
LTVEFLLLAETNNLTSTQEVGEGKKGRWMEWDAGRGGRGRNRTAELSGEDGMGELLKDLG